MGSIAEGMKFVKTILIRCNLVQPVAVNKCAEIGQLFNYSQIKVNAKQATKYPKIISKLSKCKTSNKIYKKYSHIKKMQNKQQNIQKLLAN